AAVFRRARAATVAGMGARAAVSRLWLGEVGRRHVVARRLRLRALAGAARATDGDVERGRGWIGVAPARRVTREHVDGAAAGPERNVGEIGRVQFVVAHLARHGHAGTVDDRADA